MTQPTANAPNAAAAAPKFYRDVLDDSLIRIGADGIPDILWPDGTWHAYPDADVATELKPLNPDGVATLAAGADLNAPRDATSPQTPQQASPRPRA